MTTQHDTTARKSPPTGGGYGPLDLAVRLQQRAETYCHIWRAAPDADAPAAWRAFCAAHDASEAAWDAAFGRGEA